MTFVRDTDLDAVRRMRAELYESMADLDQALAAPAVGRIDSWLGRVDAALAGLSTDFGEHVALTERAHGLHEDIVQGAPRLANAVTRLAGEHVQIAELLDELRTDLGAARGDEAVESLRELATTVLGRLARHRQRGADLIYEAYESDIGGET